jgi:hypothetical protein
MIELECIYDVPLCVNYQYQFQHVEYKENSPKHLSNRLETSKVDTLALPVAADTDGDDELDADREQGEEQVGDENKEENKETLDDGEDGSDQVGDEAGDGLNEGQATSVRNLGNQDHDCSEDLEDELKK